MTMECDQDARASTWQASFELLLPGIRDQCRRQLARFPAEEREEAMQATIAYAAVAYARLAERDQLELAFPTPLVSYGLKQYRAGRMVGTACNSRDVCSKRCQRKGGYAVETMEDWNEVLSETRRATPAEIATASDRLRPMAGDAPAARSAAGP
jgi:hypothetical protein